MRFLIFGDVSGRPGREAVTRSLPDLRAEYQPDSVIVNIENMAHGFGLTADTFAETKPWKVDAYTTGDHAWDNKAGLPVLENPDIPIVRPANYPDGVPGRGYHIIQNGAVEIAVINLQGQVFFKRHPLNPFHTLDALLKLPDIARCPIKLIDFHAEATSEKRALGWHADGRVSAIWGTHTHVPTADAQMLPQGTGFISDVGMNGNYHSIIGVDRSGPLKTFLTQLPSRYLVEEEGGPLEVGALLLDIDPTSGKTSHIEHVRHILD